MKQMTIEINIDEALTRLDALKYSSFYKRLDLMDKASIQFAVDYIEKVRKREKANEDILLSPEKVAEECFKAYDIAEKIKSIIEELESHDKLISEIFEHLWYLKKNSTHYKKLMKIHTPIMEAFMKKTDHLGERMELGNKVKELSENILKSLEEGNE